MFYDVFILFLRSVTLRIMTVEWLYPSLGLLGCDAV